jgi:hypothetical protein
MWKNHIDSDLVEAFMDRMFETYRYSFYDMEKSLKDFAYSSNICNDAICEDCLYIKALDDRIEKINELRERAVKERDAHKRVAIEAIDQKDKTIRERDEARKDSKRNLNLYVSMKEKYKQLKENSIIFSMEEREW